MSHERVLRKGLKILGSLSSGTGDPILTRDATSLDVGAIPSIDLSTYLTNVLTSTYVYVGNGSNIATGVSLTGAINITNAGLTSITPEYITNTHVSSVAAIDYSKLNLSNSILNGDISSSAGIDRSKIATGSTYRILINNNLGEFSEGDAITPSYLLISDTNGIPVASTIDSTTASYLDPTSSVQTQLNNRLSFSSGIMPSEGDIIQFTGGLWDRITIGAVGTVLTSDGTNALWSASTANGLPSEGTTHQYLRKIDNTSYNVEWDTLTLLDISDITASATEVNILDGLTATTTQLNFVDATSSIQTQLNNKLNDSLPYNALFVGDAGNNPIPLAAGSDTQILTITAGVPTWQTPTPPGNVSSATAPSIDNELTRFNGTVGDSIQGGTGIIISDTAGMAFPTAGALQTKTSAGNTLLLQAYDVDGAAYTTFGTLTANNTPTFDLTTSVTIGGAAIYRAGGTDVSLADGGTGASLSDPGADKLLGWDDTDNATTWFTLGAGLTYTHATHTLSAAGGGASSFITLTDAPVSYAGSATYSVVVNGAENAVEFALRVANVTGTSNKITIGGTGLNPTIDIAATYVGQASITTLGTIITGVWNATKVAEIYGGTNQNSYTQGDLLYASAANTLSKLTVGTSSQVLSGGTVPAWTSVSSAMLRNSAGLSVIGRSTNSTGVVADITGTAGQFLKVTGTTLGFTDIYDTIEIGIGGGGVVPSTGILGDYEVKFDCTVIGWTVIGESGSIVVDVWKKDYANFSTISVADTITGSEKPTLSSTDKNQDLTLSTWTTTLTRGDILRFNIDSISTLTRATVSLRVIRV